MSARETQTQATWGIAPAVRRTLARTVLDLRAAIEDDFRRQLAALGVRESGIQPIPAGRTLSAHDQLARLSAVAAIQRDAEAGISISEALGIYIREAAYTFLNRVVGLRCLEERGLLMVDGQSETAIKSLPSFNAPSLYWQVRNELPSSTSPREVWRETLRRACCAVSQPVRVVLGIEEDDGDLLPLQATLQKVVDAFNNPDIPPETYAEDEFLGWVYQYYNQQEKDQVYQKLGNGNKIERPEELAAATCLYTERYMVDYLLQNTLGALWVEMHIDSRLPQRWPYHVQLPEGSVRPQRPVRRLRDISLMDPACGSGHFLVRAFDLLAQMYDEEGLERAEEVPYLILERNLHGIDIDLRAVQIAALSLYLKGCTMAGPAFRPRRLNLVAADAVLPGDAPPREYLKRFQGDAEAEALVTGIWQGLRNVREFGSLLHPERAVDEVVRRRAREDRLKFPMLQRGEAEWGIWKAELLRGLREEFERQAQSEDLGQRLFGEEAAKSVSLVEALGRKYDVVVTNPPYAGSGNLSSKLRSLVWRDYTCGKRDLYAAFVLRGLEFCSPTGHLGMVTQQSWLFMRAFADLRADILGRTRISTIAHLGPRAFEEISGGVVSSALFTLVRTPPSLDHHLIAFRLVGPRSPLDKRTLLTAAASNRAPAITFTVRQREFLNIPESPVVYWLRPRFFELLSESPRVGDLGPAVRGLNTNDDERFLRLFWEVDSAGQFVPFYKGGGYGRWFGLDNYVVEWEDGGTVIKGTGKAIIPSESLYMKPGLTFTDVADGSLGCRQMPEKHIFSNTAPGIFPNDDVVYEELSWLNSRLATYMLRAISPSLHFTTGYLNRLPLRGTQLVGARSIAPRCIDLKKRLVAQDPVERSFRTLPLETPVGNSLLDRWHMAQTRIERWSAVLHSLEGALDAFVCDAYGLDQPDVVAVLGETGRPAGWNPVVKSYEDWHDVEFEMQAPAIWRSPDRPDRVDGIEMAVCGKELRERLVRFYRAGIKSETDVGRQPDGGNDDEEIAAGSTRVVPSETLIEDLSHKLEVHPISVYWLLKEMREQDGLVCPPELKRHLAAYVSVTLLRLLGHQWPEQDVYEREHGPIMDPSLVDEDGIIPLVPCADQPTAAQRVRMRLETDFGEEGAAKSEQEFRQWVGRSIEEWLRRDFFRRHVQQFKQRPIAWHLVSPERNFEAFVLYHKLSSETLQKLRAQYAGGLITRFQAEQARARERKDAVAAGRLQAQVDDVEEFRSRIEAIQRGIDLRYRIRCRWKGEEATGRPGPYAPDIDDGVKVNIRPFQEAGLLAVKEVIKKW